MGVDGLTGKRLAQARREAHLSQRTLAAELGVTIRTVQNYEAGRIVPYRQLDTLSRLLRRSPGWLLYGSDSPRTDRVVATSRQQRRQLEQNLQRLSDLRKQLVDKRRAFQAHGQ